MRTILLSDSLSKEINKVARESGYTEEKQVHGRIFIQPEFRTFYHGTGNIGSEEISFGKIKFRRTKGVGSCLRFFRRQRKTFIIYPRRGLFPGPFHPF
jgi:hypothetical protein